MPKADYVTHGRVVGAERVVRPDPMPEKGDRLQKHRKGEIFLYEGWGGDLEPHVCMVPKDDPDEAYDSVIARWGSWVVLGLGGYPLLLSDEHFRALFRPRY